MQRAQPNSIRFNAVASCRTVQVTHDAWSPRTA